MQIAHWWAELEWGNVPQWLGAIGSSGALLATSFVITRDMRDRRWAVARGVHLAVDGLGVRVTNGSSEAIYEVMAIDVSTRNHIGRWARPVQARRSSMAKLSLAAGESVRLQAGRPSADERRAEPASVVAAFRDPNDQWWVRSLNGTLIRLRTPAPRFFRMSQYDGE